MTTGSFGKSPNFKIQRQLLLLLLLSTLLPAAIVGGYGFIAFNRVASRSLIEDFEEESVEQANAILELSNNIEEDVHYLSHSYLVEGLIVSEDSSGEGNGISAATWKEQIAGNLETLLGVKSIYRKIRFVDETGQEIIRVQREEADSETIERVPESDLVNIKDQAYVAKGLTLEDEQLHVSPIALQSENGELLQQLGGITHYVEAVFDSSGQRRGMVIISVFAEEMFEIVEEIEEEEIDDGEDEELYIVNADGYYLNHEEEEKLWGFDLGTEETLQADYEESAVETILTSEQGVVKSGANLIAYAKVDPSATDEGEHFYITEALPGSSVYGPANAFRRVAALVTLLSLAIALPIGIFGGRRLIGLVERLINGISASSQQIFSTVSEQERIASQQAASVSETSTTMEELEASSRQSAEQAMAAVAAAKTAREQAEIGEQAVDDTLAGMFTLEQKVDAIAQQIVNLSGQADEIGSISQTVSDFASQTNMLALNSSVEAIRAGEHGRGFAVVANEIRKLSEQSQLSADKINTLVAEIQRLINQTVMVTEEGTKTAKAGVRIAKRTERAFDDIKRGIDAVVVNNQQVSLTQKQQVDAIRQVVTAMEVIDRSSKESATGLSQTRTGTQQLNETAQSLRKMM
ncbi:MAG: methyl-accepting chemotaxis protein [Cyanobacteria bacterium J06650_10]